MSNYDYQEALNARAEQNRETEAERLRKAEEAEHMNQVLARAKGRRRALRSMLVRLSVALAMIVAIFVARHFELIAPELAIPLSVILLGWACAWFGAWLQFSGRRMPI